MGMIDIIYYVGNNILLAFRGGVLMRIFSEENVTKKLLKQVKCNLCGQQLKKDDFGYIEDHLSVNKTWGYGQPVDGETHAFDLCYDCYTDFISRFKIPTKVISAFGKLEEA